MTFKRAVFMPKKHFAGKEKKNARMLSTAEYIHDGPKQNLRNAQERLKHSYEIRPRSPPNTDTQRRRKTNPEGWLTMGLLYVSRRGRDQCNATTVTTYNTILIKLISCSLKKGAKRGNHGGGSGAQSDAVTCHTKGSILSAVEITLAGSARQIPHRTSWG